MNTDTPAIQVSHLQRCYGKTEAVHDLTFTVQPGRCYGFFGRNGSGKTTTIKCLLNLLRPDSGEVRLFGMDPRREEVKVKQRLAYVPDMVGFYPWMSVQGYFEYLASFRSHWNLGMQQDLLSRFDLDPGRKADDLSRGEKMQVALIGALCPEPELLVLDEPTSGLDPVIRREFIRTVIGAYQDADPEKRTVLVSTHLIAEFEGLIDEFTVIDQGRDILTMETETAREQFKVLRARFAGEPPSLAHVECLALRQEGREVELTVNGESVRVREQLEAMRPESIDVENLGLEQIFLASLKKKQHSTQGKRS